MKFESTRGKDVEESASYAIAKGLADDGGLFVPATFPNLKDKLQEMLNSDYAERSAIVMGSFLDEYDQDDLLKACKKAYSQFDDNDPAPVIKLNDNLFVMELFHGPTLAFKDIALTILPYLLRKGANRIGIKEEILILVATSGDTGKAALSGFKDADGIKIMVFYPSEGVSDMQKLQMRTQSGNNVNVVGINGNFDDCQNQVKKIFSDKNACKTLKDKNVILSSANSISFGRLVPQVAYYFSSYLDLVNAEEISMGDEIDFVVPTGNFGDILAGYYAKKMGLPVHKLICASNSNNVLTEFFADGTYDRNREFFKTMSPSMDILISSNLERLLYEVSNRDATLTKERMDELKLSGKYTISEKEKKEIVKDFSADYSDEEECVEEIKNIFEDYGYCADTHTAVGLNVYRKYSERVSKQFKTVVLSTASPYKFPQSVYKAISGKTVKDAFIASEKLFNETAMEIPNQIKELKTKEVRFNEVVDKDQAFDSVIKFINK